MGTGIGCGRNGHLSWIVKGRYLCPMEEGCRERDKARIGLIQEAMNQTMIRSQLRQIKVGRDRTFAYYSGFY